MEVMFILSQASSIIAWLLLVYSYYKENINKLLFIQIISGIFYALSYLFLGAISGFSICVFELIQTFGFYKTDKDKLIFYISLVIYILIGIFTFDGWISIIPIIASIVGAYSLTKNKKIATIGGILSYIGWITYDIMILSYSNAITDVLLVLSNLSILLIGRSRLIKTQFLHFITTPYVGRNILAKIYDLDAKNYGKDYTWNIDYEKRIYEKNRKSYVIIKDNTRVVGYISYLVINKNIFDKILRTKKMINNYDIGFIDRLKKSNKNYILLESINIERKYQNYNAINKIKNNISQYIRSSYNKHYYIDKIISIAVSDFEKDTLEDCYFDEIKELPTKEKIYVLNSDKIKENYLTKEYKKKVEKNKYSIVANEDIDDEIINGIYNLDKEFYSKKYLWNSDYQKFIFNINNNSLITVLYNDELIGYINYLCVSEDLYDKCFSSKEAIDNYKLDDIKKYRKTYPNYIIINSVVISKKFQNGYAIKLLSNRFIKEIRSLIRNGYKIKGINSTAISKDGRKFCEQFGLKHYKKYEDNTNLYYLDEKEVMKRFI